ncbi:MAG: DUF2733 domain-containing protein [Ruminococcaceae bacterium]|nr:DUF2733 domain-containing protein [Oscillospiraceae bacterium]
MTAYNFGTLYSVCRRRHNPAGIACTLAYGIKSFYVALKAFVSQYSDRSTASRFKTCEQSIIN